MAKPPKYQIPGTRRGAGIPPGYLVGRLPAAGKGPAQLLNVQQLLRFGINSTKTGHGTQALQAGFTFSVQGKPTNNEFVGQGVWSQDITFHNDDGNNVVTALSAATGTPAFRMLTSGLVLLGQIEFAAGSKLGTVVWQTDPYVHPAGAEMLLYCPNTADATLASVAGRVVGYLG